MLKKSNVGQGTELSRPRHLTANTLVLQGVDINRDCVELKPCLEPTPHCQQELEESCGVPLQVFIKDDFCIAVFSWGAVAFPPELEERLAALIGRKSAILRIGGRFLMRDLDAEAHASSCRQIAGAIQTSSRVSGPRGQEPAKSISPMQCRRRSDP